MNLIKQLGRCHIKRLCNLEESDEAESDETKARDDDDLLPAWGGGGE